MSDQVNIEHPDRPLQRSSTDRLVAGVSQGVARYLDLDVTVVRLAFVVLGFFGIGVPLYVAAWLLIPDEVTNVSILADLFAGQRAG